MLIVLSTMLWSSSEDGGEAPVIKPLLGVRVMVSSKEAAVGGGVGGILSLPSSESPAKRSSDFKDGSPPTELSSSVKSAPLIEKRIGGSAGAIKVEWDTFWMGDDSDISSEPSALTMDTIEPFGSILLVVTLSAGGWACAGLEGRKVSSGERLWSFSSFGGGAGG